MQYTQAQIDRANAVSLEDFLRTQGETLIKSGREYRGKLAVFTGINNFKFRHQVTPGDTLRLTVTLTRARGNMGKADACAYVGDAVAAKGEISFALIEKKGEDKD